MIHWGFIGCGDVVEHKSGKPFWVDGQSEVVAVASRQIANAKAFAARHNIPSYYDDAAQLIANPAVDAIYVATPPSTHMPYAMQALAAGKPVYVEKPMGITLVECQAAVTLAKEKAVPLLVAYYRRSLPYYHKVKALLAMGEIGQIQAVHLTHFVAPQGQSAPAWKRDAAFAGGGLFYDVGCHALDVLDFIFGEITQVGGSSQNVACQTVLDDAVAAQFTFASGVVGTALWCFESGLNEDAIQVIGTKGRLTFHVFGNEMMLETAAGTQQITVASPTYMQAPMIANILAHLQGVAQADCTGEVALRTAQVMEQIVMS